MARKDASDEWFKAKHGLHLRMKAAHDDNDFVASQAILVSCHRFVWVLLHGPPWGFPLGIMET
jgi:hypothetical protein